MDHFNAMFEDSRTRSWWRQATGEAIAGPLKGSLLEELPSYQMTLRRWLEQYPSSLIMQPDSNFKKQYADLDKYDLGNIPGSLEKRDSASWRPKSWVIGMVLGGSARAYDWNDLQKLRLIQDTLGGQPILISLDRDSLSFHAWSRQFNNRTLEFKIPPGGGWQDLETGSLWNESGLCTAGPLKGSQLQNLQAYQEFWHSWQSFHAGTSRYLAGK
jgi:hypothetical protein